MNKKTARLRRARKTRMKISDLKVVRLCVLRTNNHIYAQIIDPSGSGVLASASTLDKEIRNQVKSGSNRIRCGCGQIYCRKSQISRN